jgi:hypothetical protein
MFSVDRGETWVHHHVITEVRGYNYTTLREIAPGRLLYIHDAPRMQALYVDVERLPDTPDAGHRDKGTRYDRPE